MHPFIRKLRALLTSERKRLEGLPPKQAVIVHIFLLSPGRSWRENVQVILCREGEERLAFVNVSYTAAWRAKNPLDKSLRGYPCRGDWLKKVCARVDERIAALAKRSFAPSPMRIGASVTQITDSHVEDIARHEKARNPEVPDVYRLSFRPRIRYENLV